MTLHLRRAWAPLLMLAMVFGVAGCDEPESGTRNIVDIIGLNENVPLLSSVYDRGQDLASPDDDSIPTDVVQVIFKSRPHDDVLTTVGPGQPFGSVRFLTYDLVWEGDNPNGADLDENGTVDLLNTYGAGMNAVVATGSLAEANVLIVASGIKTQAPLACLGPLGNAEECSSLDVVDFRRNAILTFYGTEETSGASIKLSRKLSVVFGQYDSN